MHEHERRTRTDGAYAKLHDRLLYRGARLRLASRWSVVAGVRGHARVREDGDGSAVVFVHGIAVSGRYLVPTAARVAERCRVYVPDLPGFGRSRGSPRARSLAGLAEALREWLDVFGLERPAFVANSFGCQVVAELAVRAPERVGRTVFVGPTIDRHARSYAHQTLRLAADAVREPFALDLIQAWDYATFMLRGNAPLFAVMLRDAVEDRLPRVRVPVLVVRGERDPIVPEAWAREVTRTLPDARLVVVPRAAHAVNYDAPDELARLVLDAVSR